MKAIKAETGQAMNLEKVTIFYNVGEGVISILAGASAGLVSLLGFGLDSAIEVFTAILVLRHISAEVNSQEISESSERRSLKLIAMTFFALAGFLVIESVHNLLAHAKPETSLLGLGATAFSALFMPWLAKRKAYIGRIIGSKLLIADAAETKLCGWLALSTFLGILAFHFFHLNWLDSLTSLIIAGFAINEGREAWEGELVCEDE